MIDKAAWQAAAAAVVAEGLGGAEVAAAAVLAAVGQVCVRVVVVELTTWMPLCTE